ncbi:mannosyltransferase [Lambiella insularis]|nr:mannosyltransferase [Lambiella insularis]
MDNVMASLLKVTVLLLFTFAFFFVSIRYFLPVAYSDRSDPTHGPARYQILVLGDIGRSPRMQYHAISMGRYGGPVDLIGYSDSELHPDVLRSPSITVYPLPRIPQYLQTNNRLLFLLVAPVKVAMQILGLFLVLGYLTMPARALLVQNPPSIPTLLVAHLVCFLRGTRLVIDWHNFGYSVLALKLGSSHPLVFISRWYESFFSRNAAAHLVVSNAMASVLSRDFWTRAPVFTLHDRPASHFRPLSREKQLAFLGRLPETAGLIDAIEKHKMKVIVSSTSWTMDEDFSLLLDALVGYSKLAMTSHPQLPEIMVIITGKGPQQAHYLSKIANLESTDNLEMVTIKTAWLSTADYASLLASADIGISLHQSTSGVDLPMKVVDMFGAGLPVVGWGRFAAWPELVQDRVNGRSFGSAEELQIILVELLGDDVQQLENLRLGALKESRNGWDNEWDSVVGKLFGML